MTTEKLWLAIWGLAGALIVSASAIAVEDLDAILSFETKQEEGIRAGRDEILEQALRYLLGDGASHDEIKTIAARPES